MAKAYGKYVFHFNKSTIILGRNLPQPSLTFLEFEQNKSVCCFFVWHVYATQWDLETGWWKRPAVTKF